MKYLTVSDARAQLPSLIDEVASQNEDEIIITRHGKPIAKIIACKGEQNNYPLRGVPIYMSDDFNEPMTDLWEALEC